MDGGETARHDTNPLLSTGFPPPSPAPEPEQRMETLQIPQVDEHEVDFVNKMVKLSLAAKAGASLAARTNYRAVKGNDHRHIFALVEEAMTPSEFTAFRAWDFGRGEQPPLSEPSINWAEPQYMKPVPKAFHDSNETLTRYIDRVCVLGEIFTPSTLAHFASKTSSGSLSPTWANCKFYPLSTPSSNTGR